MWKFLIISIKSHCGCLCFVCDLQLSYFLLSLFFFCLFSCLFMLTFYLLYQGFVFYKAIHCSILIFVWHIYGWKYFFFTCVLVCLFLLPSLSLSLFLNTPSLSLSPSLFPSRPLPPSLLLLFTFPFFNFASFSVYLSVSESESKRGKRARKKENMEE